jgi:hypothetical protein
MAQAASLRPLTAEAEDHDRFSPCGICGGPSGNRTGLYSRSSASPCRYHSTIALRTRMSPEG